MKPPFRLTRRRLRRFSITNLSLDRNDFTQSRLPRAVIYDVHSQLWGYGWMKPGNEWIELLLLRSPAPLRLNEDAISSLGCYTKVITARSTRNSQLLSKEVITKDLVKFLIYVRDIYERSIYVGKIGNLILYILLVTYTYISRKYS